MKIRGFFLEKTEKDMLNKKKEYDMENFNKMIRYCQLR